MLFSAPEKQSIIGSVSVTCCSAFDMPLISVDCSAMICADEVRTSKQLACISSAFRNCVAKLKLFADDVKLYSSFNVDVSNCGVDVSNCGDLQQSLDLLSSWANSWQLNINISKCSVLSIHHISKPRPIIPHPYFINGSQLSNSSSVTDPGVLVDSHLTFNLHISNILTKAT